MAKKYYAIIHQNQSAIHFDDWNNVRSLIEGKSNIIYRGFLDKESAENFIADKMSEEVTPLDKIDNSFIDEMINTLNQKELVAFVDGSFKKVNGKNKAGYGVVLIFKNETGDIISDKLYKSWDSKTTSQNVEGEVQGATETFSYAIDRDFKKINLFYDYLGIEKWLTREWNANTDISKEYVRYYDKNLLNKIEVKFYKVMAHSGITYNEEADKLASNTLQFTTFKTNADGSLLIKKVASSVIKDLMTYLENLNIGIDTDYQYKDKREITIIKSNPDKVTLTYYPGSSSLYLQGKNNKLFTEISLFLISISPDNEMFISMNANSNIAESVVSYLIPDTKYYENKLKTDFLTNCKDYQSIPTIIQQDLIMSVFRLYNKEENLPVFNYESYLLSPLRSIEYYLKQLLVSVPGIILEKLNSNTGLIEHTNIGGWFNINSADRTWYITRSDIKNHYKDSDKIDLMNKMYTLIQMYRHPTFHRNSKADTILLTYEKIQEIIKYILNLINDYYK